MSNGRTREQMSADMKAYWRRRKARAMEFARFEHINPSREDIYAVGPAETPIFRAVTAARPDEWKLDG